MTRLRSRLERVETAAGPHLGQRIEDAYENMFWFFTDAELERIEELFSLPEDAPERVAMRPRTRELMEGVLPGSSAWVADYNASMEHWPKRPRDYFKAPRSAWARVPFTPPPAVPLARVMELHRGMADLEPGLELDAHLDACLALAFMHRLQAPLQAP